jgi:TPR repeat protein
MANKAKLMLVMSDEVPIRTLEELREHFDLVNVLSCFFSGKLSKWLVDRHYGEAAEKISARESSVGDIKNQLRAILGASCLDAGNADLADIIRLANEAEDWPEAASWWRMAAEKGDKQAQFHLGKCYAYGQGVEMNAEEAARWYRKAAEQGHVRRRTALGVLTLTAKVWSRIMKKPQNGTKKLPNRDMQRRRAALGLLTLTARVCSRIMMRP